MIELRYKRRTEEKITKNKNKNKNIRMNVKIATPKLDTEDDVTE